MERLLIIDAYSQIFRMFYGINNNLKSPENLNTNAIYGIARLLFQLDKEFPSSDCVVAFDKGKCAIRTALQPSYKMQRKPMPPELSEQIEFIYQWFDAMGWNIFEQAGVEADDIIAGCVIKSRFNENLIVSSDKDLMQLVNEKVTQLVPAKQGIFNRFSTTEVTEKFGVKPNQVLDYLSLVGDSADNVAGVDGIGPKTATKILENYHSLENIFANSETITEKVIVEKILPAKNILAENFKMIKLYPDQFKISAPTQRREINYEKLFELAVNFGFKSMLPEIEKLKQRKKIITLFDF